MSIRERACLVAPAPNRLHAVLTAGLAWKKHEGVSVGFEDYKAVLEWTKNRKPFNKMKWGNVYLLTALVAKIEDAFAKMGEAKVDAMIFHYIDFDDVTTFRRMDEKEPVFVRIKSAIDREMARITEEMTAQKYLNKASRQKMEDDEPVMVTCASGGKCSLEMMSSRGAQRVINGGKTYEQMYPGSDVAAAQKIVDRGEVRRATPPSLWAR